MATLPGKTKGINGAAIPYVIPVTEAGEPAGFAPQTTSPLTGTAISFAASGDNTIIAAVVGQTTRVHRMYFTTAGATTIIFKRGATALTGAMTLATGGSFFLDYSSIPHIVTAANEAVVINSSAAVQISGRVESITS